MKRSSASEFEWRIVQRIRDRLAARYGRDGDVLSDRISEMEDAIGAAALPPLFKEALARCGTSFSAETLDARFEALLCDLLTHPDDPTDNPWSRRYGFSTTASLNRAFRRRFGVSVRDVRRTAVVAVWLEACEQVARTAREQEREAEAWRRITTLRVSLHDRPVGPKARAALDALGTRPKREGRMRPRYPELGSAEADRLGGLRGGPA